MQQRLAGDGAVPPNSPAQRSLLFREQGVSFLHTRKAPRSGLGTSWKIRLVRKLPGFLVQMHLPVVLPLL